MDTMGAMEETVELMKRRVGAGMRGHSMRKTGDSGTAHVLEMRDKMRAGMSRGKAKRWLGYIQGVLVAHDVATLTDVKDINRRHA